MNRDKQRLDIANLFLSIKDHGGKQYYDNDILNDAFEDYFKTNYSLRNPQYYEGEKGQQQEQRDKKRLKKTYFSNTKRTDQNESVVFDELEVGNNLAKKENLKVAIANTIVNKDHIAASMFNDPILTSGRRKKLIDILNQAEKCKSDILVLPEVSIPYEWLSIIADESRRKQRAIIAGLEHLRINNVCFNLIATCLPVERQGIKDVVVVLRLKNHYSPHESFTIRNRGKIVPVPAPSTYNKFIWHNVHFSTYNCYELADITHRSIFRSEVDILFASEYNRDVNHFSNIVETISRDIHCYFVQVNSSDLGDSRITKPSRTETRDIIRLKGGKNDVVLYDEINLNELRVFQATRVDGQNTMRFKNTPPNYDHDRAEDRLN